MVGGTGPDPGPLTSAEVDRWYSGVADERYGWIIESGVRCIGVARLHHVDEQVQPVNLVDVLAADVIMVATPGSHRGPGASE